jgi:hypothetical protein
MAEYTGGGHDKGRVEKAFPFSLPLHLLARAVKETELLGFLNVVAHTPAHISVNIRCSKKGNQILG